MKWNESGFRPPLCTYRLNWVRRTSWGWWDEWEDIALQTQNSNPGGLIPTLYKCYTNSLCLLVSYHPRVKVSIVGSLRDREVACVNFESCVWRIVSFQSSHYPQEVLLAQFSLYVHKGGLKPDSFHFICVYWEVTSVLKVYWRFFVHVVLILYRNKSKYQVETNIAALLLSYDFNGYL